MKQYKIEETVPEVVRVRRAEAGDTLMAPVHNEVGQLLMQEGHELTEKDLRRLRKYGVKKITLRTRQPRWVREEELEELPSELEVLETREIEDEQRDRVEQIEETDGLEELFEQVQWLDHGARREAGENRPPEPDFLVELRELVDLQETVRGLRENLEDHPRSEQAHRLLEALDGERSLESVLSVRDLPDSLLTDVFEVLSRRDDLKQDLVERLGEFTLPGAPGTVPDRPGAESANESGSSSVGEWVEEGQLDRALLEVLEGLENDKEVDGALVEECRRELLELHREKEDREELVRQTHQEVHDERLKRHLLDALDGLADLEDPPPADHTEEIEHQTELIERITAFNEGRAERRQTIETLFGELREGAGLDHLPEEVPGDSGTAPEAPRDPNDGSDTDWQPRLDDLLETVKGTLEGGVRTPADRTGSLDDPLSMGTFEDLLGQRVSLDEEVRTSLEFCQNQFQQLRKRRRSIQGRIEMDTEDPERARKLTDMLDHRPGEEDSGDVPEPREDSELVERIRRFLDRKRDYARQTQDTLEGLRESLPNPEPLEDLDEFYARVESEIDSVRGDPQFREDGDDSPGPDSPSPQRTQREEFIRTENYSGLARRTDLSVAIVKQALEFFSRPGTCDEPVTSRLERSREILFDVLFHARFQPDKLREFTADLREDLRSEPRPIQWFAQPENPAEFGLVHAHNGLLLTNWILESTDLDEERANRLSLAALVQDLGMVVLPMKKLLGQPDLSERARDEIKKHPIYTGKILQRTCNLESTVGEMALQHHERSGGQGYPQGLDADEQEPGSSLLQVVDVYSALLENRPDRDPMPPNGAAEILHEENLDPRWVQALESTVGRYPNGGYVVLSDGTLGQVRDQNGENPDSPTVMLVSDENRHPLDSPRAVDLSRSSRTIRRLVKW